MRFVRWLKEVAMWTRNRHAPPIEAPRPLVTPGLLEAQRAHADARASLEQAIHQGPEIRAVVNRVAGHGVKNHWTDDITDAFYGNPGHSL